MIDNPIGVQFSMFSPGYRSVPPMSEIDPSELLSKTLEVSEDGLNGVLDFVCAAFFVKSCFAAHARHFL